MTLFPQRALAQSGGDFEGPTETPEPTSQYSFVQRIGPILYQWTIVLGVADDGGDELEIKFKIGGERYIGWGIASEGMTGPLITCFVNIDMDEAICSEWMGSGTSLGQRVPQSEQRHRMQTWWREVSWTDEERKIGQIQNSYTVTLRVPVARMGIEKNVSSRIVWSTGEYDIENNRPLPHQPFDRGEQRIHVYSVAGATLDKNISTRAPAPPPPTSPDSTTTASEEVEESFMMPYMPFMPYIFGISPLIIYIFFGATMRAAQIVFTPTGSRMLAFLTGLFFVLIVLAYTAMHFVVYQPELAKKGVGPGSAATRALGEGVVLCLWFIIFPAPKHVGVAQLVGSSYQRAIPYHAMIGIMLFLVATAHGAVAALDMPSYQTGMVSMDGPNPPLHGLVAWFLALLIVLTSIGRRYAYKLYQVTHMLYIPMIAAAALHHPSLVLTLAPPALNLVVDWVVRFKSQCSAAIVTAARYNPNARVSVLTVKLASRQTAKPGEFVLVSIDALGCGSIINPRALCVAWYDSEENEATLYVKSNGAMSWTADFCAEVANGQVVEGQELTWRGPYGNLQVPLGTTSTIVLVAAGVGIAPMLRVLQTVWERIQGGEYVRRVVLLWTVRSALFAQELEERLVMIRESIGIPIVCYLFVTGMQHLPDSHFSHVFDGVFQRRMTPAEDIPVALNAMVEVARAADTCGHVNNRRYHGHRGVGGGAGSTDHPLAEVHSPKQQQRSALSVIAGAILSPLASFRRKGKGRRADGGGGDGAATAGPPEGVAVVHLDADESWSDYDPIHDKLTFYIAAPHKLADSVAAYGKARKGLTYVHSQSFDI